MSADARTIVVLHLDDQAPKLGSGRRHVEVVSRGRRWVRVRDPHIPTAQCVRLPRETFLRALVEEDTGR